MENCRCEFWSCRAVYRSGASRLGEASPCRHGTSGSYLNQQIHESNAFSMGRIPQEEGRNQMCWNGLSSPTARVLAITFFLSRGSMSDIPGDARP